MNRTAANGIVIRLTEEGKKILSTDYLFYMLQYAHMQGSFKALAKGITRLKNITVADVKELRLQGAVRIGDVADVKAFKDGSTTAGDIILIQKGSDRTVGTPRMAKKKKEKTPPFIAEELLGLSDVRIGTDREAVLDPGKLDLDPDKFQVREMKNPAHFYDVIDFQLPSGRPMEMSLSTMDIRDPESKPTVEWVRAVEVDFKDPRFVGNQYKLTEKGEAFETLKMVLGYTEKFVQDHSEIKYIVFSADRFEGSRVSLYRRLIKKFSGGPAWERDRPGSIHFTVKNPYYVEPTDNGVSKVGSIWSHRRPRVSREIFSHAKRTFND